MSNERIELDLSALSIEDIELMMDRSPSSVVNSNLVNLKLGNPNRVMDLGSGTGRNSLLVARNGFCVTAVDNDPNKIAELKKRVDRENGIEGRIETLLADIATMDFAKETIDNALLSFVLRFQNDHDFYDIIDRIQNATTSGGLHIVQELTENGPLYDSRKPGHWPARNELLDLYKKAGWSILEHIVEIGPTAYPHPKGPKDRPAMHEAVALVARKPR